MVRKAMPANHERTQKRPWLAALLAFLQPGLGHLYLRAWVRALLWFVLWVTTVSLVAPLPAEASGFVSAISTTMASLDNLSFEASIALFSVTMFSMLDAYWLAARTNTAPAETGPRCPNCGKEVEAELGFCHWCTHEFDPREVW
jgi:hypothetical protein